ncbi:MAG: hypothetical protein LBP59_17635, partial [Planctomycetaceae bacterium]|nr:hypothetical protein [Planctomycetaceae bacterium]
AEGLAEGKRSSILKFLNSRFKSVPKKITQDLLACDDLVKLESLLDCAIECKSLAEFENKLK